MRKYTDIQLSRILSVCAEDRLGGPGHAPDDTMCIEQAAQASLAFKEGLDEDRFTRYDNPDTSPSYTELTQPQKFLAWLEKNGMA